MSTMPQDRPSTAALFNLAAAQAAAWSTTANGDVYITLTTGTWTTTDTTREETTVPEVRRPALPAVNRMTATLRAFCETAITNSRDEDGYATTDLYMSTAMDHVRRTHRYTWDRQARVNDPVVLVSVADEFMQDYRTRRPVAAILCLDCINSQYLYDEWQPRDAGRNFYADPQNVSRNNHAAWWVMPYSRALSHLADFEFRAGHRVVNNRRQPSRQDRRTGEWPTTRQHAEGEAGCMYCGCDPTSFTRTRGCNDCGEWFTYDRRVTREHDSCPRCAAAAVARLEEMNQYCQDCGEIHNSRRPEWCQPFTSDATVIDLLALVEATA